KRARESSAGRSSGASPPGPSRVIDGDTLELLSPEFRVCPPPEKCPEEASHSANITVRLLGLDSPEMDQICLDEKDAPWPCGEAARYDLMRLIAGEPVTCFGGGDGMGRDRYERELAICHV
ncbi:MAG TPA: hypothetical protein VLL72_11915, partial [Kiloniellales bacterium]|nr:hypothetical protein [Kiloniellales bacterium]